MFRSEAEKTKGKADSKELTKYKFDNQILMKKLSEYKKAEKGAVQLVKDYDDMKVKYFKVLEELAQQKEMLKQKIQDEVEL